MLKNMMHHVTKDTLAGEGPVVLFKLDGFVDALRVGGRGRYLRRHGGRGGCGTGSTQTFAGGRSTRSRPSAP